MDTLSLTLFLAGPYLTLLSLLEPFILPPASYSGDRPVAPEGQSVAWLGTGNRGATIYQRIDPLRAVLVARHTYTLEVEVGNRADQIGFPGYKVQLLAIDPDTPDPEDREVVLKEDDNTLSPTEGTFETSEVIYECCEDPNNPSMDLPELEGRQLEIRLISLGPPPISSPQVNFDNVRLREGQTFFTDLMVINVDAQVNGPPEHGFEPVDVFFPAGTYEATLVNPTLHPDALFTAWNANIGTDAWRTEWAGRAPTDPDPNLAGGGACCGATPQEAFDQTPAKTRRFTTAIDEVVQFMISDNVLGDNGGASRC